MACPENRVYFRSICPGVDVGVNVLSHDSYSILHCIAEYFFPRTDEQLRRENERLPGAHPATIRFVNGQVRFQVRLRGSRFGSALDWYDSTRLRPRHENIEDAFLRAKATLDLAREDGSEDDLPYLPQLEEVFGVRFICFVSNMLVDSEERYLVSDPELVYETKEGKGPLIGLYLTRTDEKDHDFYWWRAGLHRTLAQDLGKSIDRIRGLKTHFVYLSETAVDVVKAEIEANDAEELNEAAMCLVEAESIANSESSTTAGESQPESPNARRCPHCNGDL